MARALSAYGQSPTNYGYLDSIANLNLYADNYLTYDADGLVASNTVQGSGTTTYTNTPSSFPDGTNTWSNEQVTTQTVNNVTTTTTTYYNFEGDALVTEVSGGGLDQITYNKYDPGGNLIETAEPSALTGYEFSASGVAEPNLRTTSGLIDFYAYYTATGPNIGPTTPGGVAGYLQASGEQQGSGGTPVWQSSVDYIAQTYNDSSGNQQTIYETADSTQYQQTNVIGIDPPTPGSTAAVPGSETTTYSYQFNTSSSNGPAIESETTIQPVVAADQHGSGVAAQSKDVYNTFGQVVWSKDANGSISYTAYDPATGAVVKQIQDVNLAGNTGDAPFQSDLGLLTGLGWTTPADGGKNLVTTYVVDSQGRTTKRPTPTGT